MPRTRSRSPSWDEPSEEDLTKHHAERAVTAADHERIAIEQLRGGLATVATTLLPAVARVVVDLDLDQRGTRALEWACSTARALRVPLHAWVTVGNGSAERSIEIEREFEADTAQSTRRWLLARGVAVDELHIASGRLNDDLVASTKDGDIVVLGVDSTEGFSEWALGSHAHQLVHALRCPLVIVPPCAPSRDDSPIVVGVDGTDANGRVLRWATRLAQDLQRHLLPVFAYNTLYDTFDNANDNANDNADTDDENEKSVGRPCDARLEELPGRPADVLGDVSLDTTAYLTVIGARHEHALRGLLVGSVVDHLLHHAPRPAAIILYGAMRRVVDESGFH